ncbi:uncharacterized protein LOC124120492 [Haliotis rufescens]|uniref:uncharacterized protein LOC124120492 n=1 Tax=Haliotis rufescens TaxID=6454 RepID=UPI00201EC7AF|nr:uncharacterized protein LOC124120492 [Haliotis rufescens]
MRRCQDRNTFVGPLSERYIVIPEDLFQDLTRTPTTIDLTLQRYRHGTHRTAGTYPRPRPLPPLDRTRHRPRAKAYGVVGVHTSGEFSAMDLGTDHNEDSEDVISQVARANFLRDDPSNILPQIRASPCLMHSKQGRRQDLIYSTNNQGGKVPSHLGQSSRSFIDKSVRQSVHKFNFETKQHESLTTKHPPVVAHKRPRLPGQYPSQDLVMSWLLHGSAPVEQNHFPDIVKDGQKTKTSKKQRHMNSLLSE